MPNPENSQAAFEDFPLADADSCVKCGLCLPHCPTYAATGLEGDSPRGRIALMQGLAQGVLPAEGRTAEHLDGCLTCRACESVCPAQVPYGKLIDNARRDLWKAGRRPGPAWRLLAWWRRTPRRIQWLGHLLRAFDRSGLRRLASALPVIGRNAALLGPTSGWPAPGHYPADEPRKGRVALFLGCVARPLDGEVAHAAIRCLNALGYSVDIPPDQGCCGAMDAHGGDAKTARSHGERNASAFRDADHVLVTASGCGIELAETLELDVQDASTFIADALESGNGALRELPCTILVHSPCTLKQMRATSDVFRLLSALPGVEVTALDHAHCCGAAGSYLFEQPALSEKLGAATRAVAEAQGGDVLATSNIGCALQLRYKASPGDAAMPVRHPLQLLAERLPRD